MDQRQKNLDEARPLHVWGSITSGLKERLKFIVRKVRSNPSRVISLELFMLHALTLFRKLTKGTRGPFLFDSEPKEFGGDPYKPLGPWTYYFSAPQCSYDIEQMMNK